MRPRTNIVAAAAALALLAGCGQDDATDAAQNAKTQAPAAQQQAEKAKDGLSPQARSVLTDAQALAGDVATTAKRFGEQDITATEAQSALKDERTRAQALGDRASSLPATDDARERLVSISRQLATTADTAGGVVAEGGDRSRLRDVVSGLRSEAADVLDRYKMPSSGSARQRLQDALDALGS